MEANNGQIQSSSCTYRIQSTGRCVQDPGTVCACQEMGMDSLAITDHGSMYESCGFIMPVFLRDCALSSAVRSMLHRSLG